MQKRSNCDRVFSTLLANCVHAEGIDTEHIFGFMIGTDVGKPGERELQNQTTGRFSKSGGRYRAVGQEFELEFVPAKDFASRSAAPLRLMISTAFRISRIVANWPGKAFPWICAIGFWTGIQPLSV